MTECGWWCTLIWWNKNKDPQKNTIAELISEVGSIPGTKVDTGAKVLAGSPDEKITEGLDGLRERLKEYYKLGANLRNGEESIQYQKLSK